MNYIEPIATTYDFTTLKNTPRTSIYAVLGFFLPYGNCPEYKVTVEIYSNIYSNSSFYSNPDLELL